MLKWQHSHALQKVNVLKNIKMIVWFWISPVEEQPSMYLGKMTWMRSSQGCLTRIHGAIEAGHSKIRAVKLEIEIRMQIASVVLHLPVSFPLWWWLASKRETNWNKAAKRFLTCKIMTGGLSGWSWWGMRKSKYGAESAYLLSCAFGNIRYFQNIMNI